MNSKPTVSTVYADSKKHYQILDGLRGVAAIVVVLFHILEVFSGGDHQKQLINHGYLAVDFFFVLSGFVIGYAYDDRWNRMSLRDFFKRRLIRLHPMIVMGMVVGAACYYFGASPVLFPAIADTPWWQLVLVMLVGFTLLPLPPSADIRGWSEMHPLNGPAWSLFFEYVANILYALLVRRFSNTLLAVLVFSAGAALIYLAVTSPNGDLIGGWSLEPAQLRIGFTRLLYPFFAGLLLSRIARPGHFSNAFFWCSLLVVAVLSVPNIGGHDARWLNGLYDALVIILLFPLIVYLGASGTVKGKFANQACRFLGDISYPIYIIHYPMMYIFMAWAVDNEVPLANVWPAGLLILAASVGIAYVSLRFYDIPVRKWLAGRYLSAKK